MFMMVQLGKRLVVVLEVLLKLQQMVEYTLVKILLGQVPMMVGHTDAFYW